MQQTGSASRFKRFKRGKGVIGVGNFRVCRRIRNATIERRRKKTRSPRCGRCKPHPLEPEKPGLSVPSVLDH